MYITAISSILIAVMLFGRHLLRSVRYKFVVAAFVPLLSLLSLFTPFFANTASAITPDEVLQKARAWSILSAVFDRARLLDTTISTSDADKCHIFGNDDANNVVVGHHVTGKNTGDGSTWEGLENRQDLANAALASVGITNGCRGLLEKLGYTYSGGNMNEPRNYGNGDDEVKNRLNDALKADAFFGRKIGDGSPGDAISYAMLYYLLTNVCGWQYRNPWSPDNGSGSIENSRNKEAEGNGWSGDTDGAHFRTWTYENGEARWNTYYKGGGSQGDIFVGSRTGFAPSGDNSAQIDCADNNADTVGAKLADNHRFADAYLALIKPGGSTTPGTCKDKYPSTSGPEQKWLTACDDGFKNKTNPNFCNEKYPASAGQQTHEACIYGQTIATGGADVTTPPPSQAPQNEEGGTTCAIVGIGWIICPVVTFLSSVVDGAYGVVDSMLKIENPLLTTGATKGVYDAWQVMRNFANVAFVIAFLIIIFSQLTSIGVSNYGIKKMLPRLVLAAVFVNVSYWICAIAVDLSNISGNSIRPLFQGIAEGLQLPNLQEFGATGTGWSGIAGGILSFGGIATIALYAQLSALLPMLVTVLFAIVTVFIVLTLRQALIILLVVVSPLAFVAFLLPNTENLFKQWRSLFQTLLLMYPLIALIFGASALASTIVMGSASGPYQVVIQIMGAAIAIIPLFILPIVMKVAGGVLNRVGAFINNPNRGPFDKLRKGAERVSNDEKARRQARAYNGQSNLPGFLGRIQGSNYRRQGRRAAISAQVGNNTQRSQQQYIAQQAQNNAAFANNLAGGTRLNPASPEALQRALAGAKFTIESAEAEEVKAQRATVEGLDDNGLKAILTKHAADPNSVAPAQVAAAIERMVKIGKVEDVEKIVNDHASTGKASIVTRTLAKSLQEDGPGFLKASDIDLVSQGNLGKTLTQVAQNNISDGVYSQEKIVAANSNELEYASKIANDLRAAGDTRAVTSLQTNAGLLQTNPSLSGKIKNNAAAINGLATNGRTP